MENRDNKKTVMTAQEVSDYLKIPLSTLYGLTKSRKILGVKIGKHWRYLKENMDAYLFSSATITKSHLSSKSFLEKRQTPRINSELQATLSTLLPRKNGLKHEGVIHNLSDGGVLFISSNGESHSTYYELGDPVKLVFKIKDENQEQMILEGRIIHQRSITRSETAFGIKFKKLSATEQGAIREYVG